MAAIVLLNKVAVAETTKPAQLVTVAKLLRVLSLLPRVTPGVASSISICCPRHQFDEIETFHWWDFAVEQDRLRISSGGHFYQPGSGGDTFTTMNWNAIPEEPAELDDYRDDLRMVPDVRSFPEGVASIDLASGGYTVEIVDDDNPLLEEQQDVEEDYEVAGIETDREETLDIGEFTQGALSETVETEPTPESSLNLSMPILTLQHAIASYRATAEFSGNGGSSEDSVIAKLAKGPNSGPEPLEANLPPGSVLVSDDASAQNMVVVSVRGMFSGGAYKPETQIVFLTSEAVLYVLAAYCMQFEKEHPSINTRFTLQRPDPVSASIAHKGTSLTVPAMQAAVWMQTDNITFTQMSHKFPITPEDWAAGEDVFLQCRRQAESMTNVVSMNSGKSTGDEK